MMYAQTKAVSPIGENIGNRIGNKFLFDYWLYEQLRRKGKSQKWLADKAKICPSVITLYLERQRVPNLNTFLAILDALGLEMEFKERMDVI